MTKPEYRQLSIAAEKQDATAETKNAFQAELKRRSSVVISNTSPFRWWNSPVAARMWPADGKDIERTS